MRITIESKGSFKNTERFLDRMKKGDIYAALDLYGRIGVQALQAATPVDSGLTASAWYYQVSRKRNSYSITWRNSHVIDGAGTPVAILLQYGHGTGTGGYVQGRDFINPAIRPVFDKIADEVWKVVRSA